MSRRSTGEALAIPDLDLSLPDGRKLARIGNLVLVPQESTLVVGPSGFGQIDPVPRDLGPVALSAREKSCSRPMRN